MKKANTFYSSSEVSGGKSGQGKVTGRQKFFDSSYSSGGKQQGKVGSKNKFALTGRHTKTTGK